MAVLMTRPWSVGEPASSKLQAGNISYVSRSEGSNLFADEEEVETNVPGTKLSTPNYVGSIDSTNEKQQEYYGLDEADEFLSLLRGERSSGSVPVVASSETGDDSPRALFLREFEEEEAFIESGLGLEDVHSPEYAKFIMEGARDHFYSPGHDSQDSQLESDILDWANRDDVGLAELLESAETELEKAVQTLQTRARAQLLEDEETKSLMQEWGLNDKAFAAATDHSSAQLAMVNPPPLGNGLGPVLHMRGGGSLRSMSPTHFQRGDGHLVMQVSSPVVVPSELGATSMDVLRKMAAAGMDGLAAQALVAMPLEDITNRGMDQIQMVEHHASAGFLQRFGTHSNGVAALAESSALSSRRISSSVSVNDGSTRFSSERFNGGVASAINDEYLNLEDLAPMAMMKIEALALEGLKIQAEMADQDAPSVVKVGPVLSEEANFIKSLQGRRSNLELDGATSGPIVPWHDDSLSHCVQSCNMMSMAVSLDEWMRLDAGACGEDETEEQTLAIIAAHNTAHNTAHSTRPQHKKNVSVCTKHRDSDQRNGRNGVMGDTITLAMLVQLRDPLRGNEPVGAPMMALVQAERVMVPPKPKMVRNMPGRRNDDEKEENKDQEDVTKPPQFKIVDVTVAGFKENTTHNSPTGSKSEVWGNKKQLQAGSRWLVAQGMQKSAKKHPALKGRATPAPQVKVQPGESLWSISARVHGSGAKWRDLAKLNPHIRNPDIIFPDTTIRTR